jgi:hypothetical protein
MILGAHWGYWLGLAVALLAGALEVVRRLRRRRRVWLAAFLEQARREAEHRLPYREDQRVRAIQQRLSRAWGKRALGVRLRRRIERELRGVDK